MRPDITRRKARRAWDEFAWMMAAIIIVGVLGYWGVATIAGGATHPPTSQTPQAAQPLQCDDGYCLPGDQYQLAVSSWNGVVDEYHDLIVAGQQPEGPDGFAAWATVNGKPHGLVDVLRARGATKQAGP